VRLSSKRRAGWSLAPVSALLWVPFLILFAFHSEAAGWYQADALMTAFPLMFVSSFVLASARRAETRSPVATDE
jgi:hypothetical protein